MDLSKKEQKISAAILSYFHKNPHAADTLEGIFNWWPEFERMEVSIDELANVIDILVERKILSVVKQVNDKALYSLIETHHS